jgi:hypothetical protein
VAAYWRRLHNEELHNLYPLSNLFGSKEDEMSGACSMHRKDEKCT